jgi:hypothetical protein
MRPPTGIRRAQEAIQIDGEATKYRLSPSVPPLHVSYRERDLHRSSRFANVQHHIIIFSHVGVEHLADMT